MELQLYDTLTRKKRSFQPIDPTRVRMYVCGPTVYDFAHIGNARPVIVFDVLFRLLRHIYEPEHVTYVRNVTDVDDKINARAVERGVSIQQVTQETYKNFKKDVAALGCLPPTFEPRATEYVRRTDGKLDMITLIQRLIDNGCAYVADGHVLFNVKSMPDYGKLARRSLDEMIAGARVEVAPFKRDPMDFVLWKPSPPELPGWDSPWGRGRPGWHIECSAMSAALLGETFDIHGGGIDLVFPHHENEIAQSRCAFHTKVMANYWMHNGFLQVEGEKMSKSLGNFVTIRELLSGEGRRPWPGEVIRLAMLATHYRQPLDFNEPKLVYWRTKLSQWASHFKLYGSQEFDYKLWTGQAEIFPSDAIVEALSDDLNAHGAFLYLDKLNRTAIKQDSNAADELGRNLIWLGLMRNAYANAYETIFFGAARPDLISKYGDAILDARAIVLNEYKFSKDSQERNANLVEVNRHINQLDPRMRTDGVCLVASEHAVVSLEPLSSESAIDKDHIENLIAERSAARKAKNFAESDRIRDELAAMGVVLKDSKEGTTWEIAR